MLTQSGVQVKCRLGISHVAIRFRTCEPELSLALNPSKMRILSRNIRFRDRRLRQGKGGFAAVRDFWPSACAIQHIFSRPNGTASPAVQARASDREAEEAHGTYSDADEATGMIGGGRAQLVM